MTAHVRGDEGLAFVSCFFSSTCGLSCDIWRLSSREQVLKSIQKEKRAEKKVRYRPSKRAFVPFSGYDLQAHLFQLSVHEPLLSCLASTMRAYPRVRGTQGPSSTL